MLLTVLVPATRSAAGGSLKGDGKSPFIPSLQSGFPVSGRADRSFGPVPRKGCPPGGTRSAAPAGRHAQRSEHGAVGLAASAAGQPGREAMRHHHHHHHHHRVSERRPCPATGDSPCRQDGRRLEGPAEPGRASASTRPGEAVGIARRLVRWVESWTRRDQASAKIATCRGRTRVSATPEARRTASESEHGREPAPLGRTCVQHDAPGDARCASLSTGRRSSGSEAIERSDDRRYRRPSRGERSEHAARQGRRRDPGPVSGLRSKSGRARRAREKRGARSPAGRMAGEARRQAPGLSPKSSR